MAEPTAPRRISPPLLPGLAGLSGRYDALFCDIWGVLHDGVHEHAAAGDALARFRQKGGTVVLATNAPIPRETVARVLAQKKVRRSAWDAIVSSGDVTRAIMIERGGGGVFHIGPERDSSLFRDLFVGRAPLETASLAVVTGLANDESETADDYRPVLARLRARRLTLVCANPDRAVHVGERLLPCAGVIGDLYEAMGGEVIWAGKPYQPIYERALAKAEEIRGAPLAKNRILMIGDSLKTDIAGAHAFGIDALFIAHGLHRDLIAAGQDAAIAIAGLLQEAGARPIAAMTELAWEAPIRA